MILFNRQCVSEWGIIPKECAFSETAMPLKHSESGLKLRGDAEIRPKLPGDILTRFNPPKSKALEGALVNKNRTGKDVKSRTRSERR